MSQKKYHRVWCDGCYDMTHFGHYNFVRQGSLYGDEVFVGIHPDDQIEFNKGCPPVFTLEERCVMLEACKWVTKVIPGAPFVADLNLVKSLKCEAVLHGDDLVVCPDGSDCYGEARKEGLLQLVPRTKAISTTNIIGRMLRLPKEELPSDFDFSLVGDISGSMASLHTYIPTTHRIAQFSEPIKEPPPNARIVYCDGFFDLLHPGHVSFLKKARALGDYLVVGVHDDNTMEQIHGESYPIMTLQERVLNVLAIKYVDDVIIGAPYEISKELMEQIKPDVVVQGSIPTKTREGAFAVPKALGIFQHIESDYPEINARAVVHRIMNNYAVFAKRNKAKEATPCELANKKQTQ